MSEQVMEKARELGRVIAESAEFKDVQKRRDEMFANEACRDLLYAFHQMQQRVAETQKQGREVPPEEQRALEQMELKMAENPLVQAFNEAQKKFQDLLNKAMEIVIRTGVERDAK